MDAKNYLASCRQQFDYYQSLGLKTIERVPENQLFWQYNPESNSIATIVKHLWGNMMSRWTDFLTSDGEKSWRERDAEFENDLNTRPEIIEKWQEGWNCLFHALDSLQPEDLHKVIYIRNQGHTVMEAINRQLCHYSYHIGQIVYLGKMIQNEEWESLSIPKNRSGEYNKEKFSKEKSREHFTDEFLTGDQEGKPS